MSICMDAVTAAARRFSMRIGTSRGVHLVEAPAASLGIAAGCGCFPPRHPIPPPHPVLIVAEVRS